MSVRKLVIAAIAATAATGATPSFAADLDRGSPYDDPRYSDIYRHPVPPPPRYAAPAYPPPPVYRDERYAAPPSPPYAAPEPRYRYEQNRYSGECVPREAIRSRLEARGWHDFHDPQPMGNVVHIRARRPSGQLFDLTLDRCTGQVLAMEPMDRRSAEAPPPDWRYRDDRYRRY